MSMYEIDNEKIKDHHTIENPVQSDWECHLFGTKGSYILTPKKGNEPNWFWRWMQFFILGNKWVKVERKREKYYNDIPGLTIDPETGNVGIGGSKREKNNGHI